MTTTATTRRSANRLGAAVLAGALALAPLAAPAGPSGHAPGLPVASALPPGGANTSDTPGTSAAVSGEVAPGGTVSWEVAGFPPGVPVYVKIDDGQLCPADAAQGACVVTSKTVGADGTASGSFALPSDVGEGSHWLRFLATGPAPERLGYSTRSPDFLVTAQSGAADGGGAVAVVDEASGQTVLVDEAEAGGAGEAGAAAGDGTAPAGAAAAGTGAGAAPAARAATSAGGQSAAGGATTGTGSTAGARQTTTTGTGSGSGLLRSSAGGTNAAAAGDSGGLTPYRNLAAPADTGAAGSGVPWWGIGALAVSVVLALAMLLASVAVTRPELLRRWPDGPAEPGAA